MSESSKYFAVLSDIHGNVDALDAVLADCADYPVFQILCLGDTIGYGSEPAACTERMMEHATISLLGNHEAMLSLDDTDLDTLDEIAVPIRLARRQLADAQLAWIRDLPLSVDLDFMTLVHASVNDPLAFNYISLPSEAAENFDAQTKPVSFHGHTHVPNIWEKIDGKISALEPAETKTLLEPGARYAINPGSVGQPRADDYRASYCLYDHENRVLHHRRVDYDVARAQARYKAAGIPKPFIRRLSPKRRKRTQPAASASF